MILHVGLALSILSHFDAWLTAYVADKRKLKQREPELKQLI